MCCFTSFNIVYYIILTSCQIASHRIATGSRILINNILLTTSTVIKFKINLFKQRVKIWDLSHLSNNSSFQIMSLKCFSLRIIPLSLYFLSPTSSKTIILVQLNMLTVCTFDLSLIYVLYKNYVTLLLALLGSRNQ